MRRGLLRGLVATCVAGAACYEVTDLEIAEPGAPTDTVQCAGQRSFGDHLGGAECWDPPTNVCTGGSTFWGVWYCKPDGSKCCYAHECFRCGWIQIQDCRDEEAGVQRAAAVCAAIKAKQPPAVAACLVDMPGPDCVLPDPAAPPDPECVIDTTQVFCP